LSERLEVAPGAWVDFVPAFVEDHAAVMAALLAELPLRVEALRMGAREVLTPRETSWHGDPECSYRYSRRLFAPSPWTPGLTAIREALTARLGLCFNAVMANYYRDGRDSMGWHADDEPELGPRAPDDVLIASVSLGAPRRFVLKPRGAPPGVSWRWMLGEGSALVMGGATQRACVHAVPKTAVPVGPRLNLTFRQVRGVPGRSDGALKF
jgi:alkylated DNA repair dioxygenase AlkB